MEGKVNTVFTSGGSRGNKENAFYYCFLFFIYFLFQSHILTMLDLPVDVVFLQWIYIHQDIWDMIIYISKASSVVMILVIFNIISKIIFPLQGKLQVVKNLV